MNFQIGDKVIHCTYGLGEVVDIEEKIIDDQPTRCYVVRANDMLIWIPINDLHTTSLRIPTPPDEFNKVLSILNDPGENLPEDRTLRKDQLIAQMRGGQLAPICEVVRDLTHFKRQFRLNEQEKSILDKAVKSLLTEWSYAQGITINQAQQAMWDRLGT